MRFINFGDEVENNYLNIDKVELCYIEEVANDNYNIKIIYQLGDKTIYKTINKIAFNYAKAIKTQSLLISLLEHDTVKVINIDEYGDITPRLHV